MGPLRALNARAPAPVPSSAAPPKPAPAPVVVAPRTNTTRMDDFSVVRKLGRGSFGEVFACVRRDDPSRRLVVVKKITMGAKRSDQEDAMNECRVLAKLDSPYVTKYYDSFVENGGKELCIVDDDTARGFKEDCAKDNGMANWAALHFAALKRSLMKGPSHIFCT